MSANALEALVAAAAERLLGSPALDLVTRIGVHLRRLVLIVPRKLRSAVVARLGSDEIADPDGQKLRITLPIVMPRRGGPTSIETSGDRAATSLDPTLIKALRAAHRLVERDRLGHPMIDRPLTQHQRRLVRLAFLAPDLQAAILGGRQPGGLSFKGLMRMRIDPDWAIQRRDLSGEQRAV